MADEQRGFGGGQLDPSSYGGGKGSNVEGAMDLIRRSLGDEGFDRSKRDGTLRINEKAVLGGTGKIATDISMMQRNIEALARGGNVEEAKKMREELNRKQDELRALIVQSNRAPAADSRQYKGFAAVQKATGRQADIEGVQLASTRSDVRAERARLRLGGDDATLSEERRQLWEQQKDELITEMRRTLEQQEEAKGQGKNELSDQLGMRMSSQGNLLSEIESVLNYNMRQNASAVDNVMGFLGNLAGILSVGQVASRAFIQDPFQYEFMPAMGAMGKQGEIGSLMSSALTSYEQYDVQMRQMGLTAGVGGVLGGIGQIRGAKSAMGAAGGVGMMALGAVAGSGLGVDMLQSVGLLQSEDDIVSAKLAEGAVDPQRLIEYYTNSRAGLLQAGGGGANLGFMTGQNVSDAGTGNTLLNQLSTEGNGGLGQLLNLGYSGEELGQLLSSASTRMRGDKGALFDAVGMSAVLESGFGVSQEQTMENMASLQRGGVAPGDVRSRMYQSMGAVAEDGQVSNYAQNVLVPALNQVVESMAIQNVARSNEQLTEEIYGFRALLSDSDTNLGRLVQANPEAFSRLYGSMVQGVKSAVDDPARLAYNMSLGSSFMDVISGSPEVMMRQINRLMGSSYISQMDFNDPDSINPGVLRNISAITGIGDLQMLISLLQVAQEQGGQLSLENVTNLQEEGAGAVAARRQEVEATELNELRIKLAEQINAAASASLSVFDEIIELQDGISKFINDGEFDTRLQTGIDKIVEATLEALGQETPEQREERERNEQGISQRSSLRNSLREAGFGGIADQVQMRNGRAVYRGDVVDNEFMDRRSRMFEGKPILEEIFHDFVNPNGGAGGGVSPSQQGGNTGASVTGREENDETVTVTITGPSSQAFTNNVKRVMASDILALQRQVT